MIPLILGDAIRSHAASTAGLGGIRKMCDGFDALGKRAPSILLVVRGPTETVLRKGARNYVVRQGMKFGRIKLTIKGGLYQSTP